MPDPWQTLDSQCAFDSRWVKLRRDTVRLPNGIELDDYYVVQQVGDFVKMFGYTDDGQVVFVRQYKHAVGRVVLELPGGFAEEGEEPLLAARREMREETGYAGDLRQVARWCVNPTREPTIEHVFFGRVSYEGAQNLDATEDIEVVLMPAVSIPEAIAEGEIEAQSTVSAALFCLGLIPSSAPTPSAA